MSTGYNVFMGSMNVMPQTVNMPGAIGAMPVPMGMPVVQTPLGEVPMPGDAFVAPSAQRGFLPWSDVGEKSMTQLFDGMTNWKAHRDYDEMKREQYERACERLRQKRGWQPGIGGREDFELFKRNEMGWAHKHYHEQ